MSVAPGGLNGCGRMGARVQEATGRPLAGRAPDPMQQATGQGCHRPRRPEQPKQGRRWRGVGRGAGQQRGWGGGGAAAARQEEGWGLPRPWAVRPDQDDPSRGSSTQARAPRVRWSPRVHGRNGACVRTGAGASAPVDTSGWVGARRVPGRRSGAARGGGGEVLTGRGA